MAAVPGKSPWLTIEGVLLILLGIAALIMPLMAGLAATLVFAWILILTGMIGLISAFAGRAHAHLGWSLASAIIALLIGIILLVYPLVGAVALTAVIGAYLLLDGIALIGLALDHRKRGIRPWAWLLASGLIDVLLAALIFFMSAVGSAVLIGFIVGLSLIFAGVALLLIQRAATPTAP
ncbi:MAG: hypothetical protein JWO83_4803 [Caulobacteraceae bacterium]|jgi:uncharacterized membrane protein HdeD (DUF308 family)|nr:hypothetical protein [Caulobacteraceae bacterium]